MPRQEKKPKIKGKREDGSFDISDIAETTEDLETAFAEEVEDPEPDTPDDAEAITDQPAGEAAEDVSERLIAERDEAIEARKRAMADFVNYRRRADENEIRATQAGVVNVVRSLIPLLDQLDLALGQEASEITTEQLLEGVQMMYGELSKTLERHQVRVIDPELASEFDPNEHQAVNCEYTDEYPPNLVAAVLQVGYAVNDTIIRPATISVTAPPDEE